MHIIPINDIQEHEELSTCHCSPTIKIENGTTIYIHNSFDGRELLEEIESDFKEQEHQHHISNCTLPECEKCGRKIQTRG